MGRRGEQEKRNGKREIRGHAKESKLLPGRLRKKGLPQPAPSLSSLPQGEKIKESSQLYAGC
jgi:hypothetical protein